MAWMGLPPDRHGVWTAACELPVFPPAQRAVPRGGTVSINVTHPTVACGATLVP